MKRILPFLCLMLLFSIGIHAQTKKDQAILLSQAFRFSNGDFSESYKGTDYLKSQFSGWDFTGNCYAIKNNYLQVGASDGSVGTVTTPICTFNGKVQVVIRIYRISGNNANYQIQMKKGDSSTTLKSGAVPIDNSSHPISFIVDDWTPETQIVISNQNSSFYVTNVDIYEIGTAFFYESFNYMSGKSEFEHYDNNYAADGNRCDNSNAVLSSDVRQTKGAVWLVSNDSYTTPALTNVLPEGKSLLTFWYAFGGNSSSFSVNSGNTVLYSDGIQGKDLKKWYRGKAVIPESSSLSSISFSGISVILDEILLRAVPSEIAEGNDNSAFIEAYDQTTCDVTLTRTLTKNIWNTLCLPFDVTTEMFGNGAKLRTLTSATNGEFVFNSVENVSAGTPFLVKVTGDVVNPVFENVTVQNVEPEAVGNTDYKFCGTYSPVYLNIDGTNVFLGTDGKFHKPTETGNRMKGLRAYFIVPSNSNPARVSILDEPSAIYSIEADVAVYNGCYDLMGRRHDEQHLTRGLYICNGKKFYVK